MTETLKLRADAILARAANGESLVPGVVAMATDRNGILYEGAAGKRMLDGGAAMSLDTVFALFSCTKAITAVAALQCVEEGLLDLDAAAKTYAPDIAKVQVLEGFGPNGAPLLRAPGRDITTRMLMLHTAGFTYEFFSRRFADYCAKTRHPSTVSGKMAALMAPLLFDPGENWAYGIGMDWCGLVVEGVRGKPLRDVCRERIFEPLGMADTSFRIEAHMRPRLASLHQRGADGALTAMPGFEFPQQPEIDMGGHAVYSTMPDFCRFMQMMLNDGAGARERILKPQTVALAASNGLAGRNITLLPTANPALTHDFEFFPGLPKSWGLSFMINDAAAPTGRAAGSLAWAGLGNLYYWIDRHSGKAGVLAAQLFPFGDPACLQAYYDFETAVYGQPVVKPPANHG